LTTSVSSVGHLRHQVWPAMERWSLRVWATQVTLYSRFVRWSHLGIFNEIFTELVEQNGSTTRLMIDATHLKAHRTAASLLKKRALSRCIAHKGWIELKTPCLRLADSTPSDRRTGKRLQRCRSLARLFASS